MKTIYILGFTALMLLSSCSSTSPKDASKNFLESLAVGNIDKVKEYSTYSFGNTIALASLMKPLKENPDFKFVFVSDSISNNKAWVRFIDDSSKNKKIITVELTKIDENWKVKRILNKY